MPMELARGDQNYPIERVAEVASWAIQIPVDDVELPARDTAEAASRNPEESSGEQSTDGSVMPKHWSAIGL